MDTLASPASILATRDWLEPILAASWLCDMLLLPRCFFKAELRATLISTSSLSSVERPRKSATEPTWNPASSSRLRFASFMLVEPFQAVTYSQLLDALLV